MNIRRSICLVASCVMLLTACGATSDDRLESAIGMLNIGTPAATPSTPSPPRGCPRDYLASLRPEGPLPSPNNIPSNTFMEFIRHRGYLIVGVDQNTKLLGYYNPDTTQYEGFDIDIANEIAKAIFGADWPSRIRYRALLTTQRIPAVKAGSVDIVADAVTVNCDRTNDVDFSNVYFMSHERILVRKDSKADIKSQEDLRGKQVCVTSGGTALSNLKKKLPYASPYIVGARTDCLVALQLGAVDGILTDDAILEGFLAQDPHTRLLGGDLTDEPYGLAIAKAHPEFVRFVNSVLEQMRSNGRWAHIWEHWFGNVQVGGPSAKAPVQPRACYKEDGCVAP
jgi:polar amino acid transport system substrate-binding protein